MCVVQPVHVDCAHGREQRYEVGRQCAVVVRFEGYFGNLTPYKRSPKDQSVLFTGHHVYSNKVVEIDRLSGSILYLVIMLTI